MYLEILKNDYNDDEQFKKDCKIQTNIFCICFVKKNTNRTNLCLYKQKQQT